MKTIGEIRFDEVSLLVTAPSKTPFDQLEKQLKEKGYSLGYKPAPGARQASPLRKFLDERIRNLYSLRYGEIDDICLSLRVRRDGETIRTKDVPRAATGPDFKKIFIGSRGRYGEILEATLRIVPLPSQRREIEIRWKRGEGRRKKDFLRGLGGSGVRPARVGISPSRIQIDLEGMTEIVRREFECLKRLAQKTRGKWS